MMIVQKGTMPFILVVDDDNALASAIVGHLEQERFRAVAVSQLRDAGQILLKKFVNLIIVNVSVAGRCGFQFIEILRRTGNGLATIFLANRGMEIDRVRALEIGDDIIQKPIVFREMVARIQAILRRAETSRDWHLTENVTLRDQTFEFCSALVSPQQLTIAFSNGHVGRVGKKELGIMALLANRRNEIVTRKDLIHGVWGVHANLRSRSLDQYIVRIRELFRRNGVETGDNICTLHGTGYLYAEGCGSRREEGDSLVPISAREEVSHVPFTRRKVRILGGIGGGEAGSAVKCSPAARAAIPYWGFASRSMRYG